MRRSLVTRRLSAALLMLVSALLFVAVAPLVWDAGPGDTGRSVLGVQALQADTLVVEQPVRLSQTPALVLVSGIVAHGNGLTGLPPRTGGGVVLTSAVIELDLSGDEPTASVAGGTLRGLLSPIIEHLAALSVEQISLRKSLLRLRLARGQTLELNDIDAMLATRNGRLTSASGRLSYLGEVYTFETQLGAPIERPADADVPAGVRRTLQLKVFAPNLAVSFDGHAEGADGLGGLRGTADVRSIEVGKLFAALGYRWSDGVASPEMRTEVRVKGPVRWAASTISFGRSEISLGDQIGVGALTVSIPDSRPRIEATLAFPALDAAQLLSNERSATGVARAPWRSIETSFPFIKRLDMELRLSVARLQWNGAPIGKGAITLSASGGKLHGDIADLQLENHVGSLRTRIAAWPL
jgi:hypothetical protein